MFLLFLFFVWISVCILSGFDVLFAYLLLGSPSIDFGIDSAATSVIKKANILTLTKETATTGENKVDGEPYETTGERAWQQNGYFGGVKIDYNMEKVNFPQNSLF